MIRRRTFLQASAATAALGAIDSLPWLRLLRPVAAAEVKLDSKLVRLDATIEPLVRLIEDTPRERLLEEVGARIRRGTGYREVLTALMLAGVRNVPPRPTVGFKFHAVLVVNSAHLASVASPPQDRWLPIFWALDQFKASQAQTMKESGWRMARADESRIPSRDKASDAFIDAMNKWDEPAADVAAAAVARHLPRDQAFELFARFAARDFRDIGHKTIYVANSFRTLDTIGWHHAEPVLRSLAYALLRRGDDEDPAAGSAEADRPIHDNAPLSAKIRNDWAAGRADSSATAELLKVLREGSRQDASNAVVKLLNTGIAPQSIWDALFCGAGELLMRRPGIVALHSVTMTNAMHYVWRTARTDDIQRTILLQNASFLGMFRGFNRPTNPDRSIDRISVSHWIEPPVTPDLIFADLESDHPRAASRTHHYLTTGGSADDLMTAARRLVFLKGTNSHDYKFSSAVLEDYSHLSPGWREPFLASSMFYLRGAKAPDNQLVRRIRAAI